MNSRTSTLFNLLWFPALSLPYDLFGTISTESETRGAYFFKGEEPLITDACRYFCLIDIMSEPTISPLLMIFWDWHPAMSVFDH